MTALVLAATMLAGCSGSDAGKDATGSGEFGDPFEVEPGLVIGSTHGAVRGKVHADTGLVVPGARANLVGTDHLAETDDAGGFLFVNVTPGTHRLRIEATGFRPYEGEAVVKASELTEIHPTLVPSDVGGDYRAHIHDYWGAKTEIAILDDSFTVDEFRVASTTSEAYPEANTVSARVVYANTVFSGLRYRIPLDTGTDVPALVYPGTNRIEVTFTWNNQPPGVPTYAFAYATAASSDITFLEPHGPGVPWSVDVTPGMTDNGHQQLSLWDFYLVPVNNAQAAPNYRPAVALEPIAIKITVFKGNDPIPEPAHPEFWAGTDRWTVRGTEGEVTTVGPNVWASGNFRALRIVPPGTKWLEVDLKWSYTDALAAAPVAPDYDLYYNPGNVHWDRFTKDYKHVPDAQTVGPGHLRFNVTVEPGEADGFYQSKTLWFFRIRNADNAAGEDGLPNDFFRARSYQLLVTAIKDPEVGVK